MKNLRWLLVFGLVLFLTEGLIAQKITTERPFNILRANTLPSGSLQIEVGMDTYKLDYSTGGEKSFREWPTSLVRFGVTDRLELRGNIAYLQTVTDNDNGEVKSDPEFQNPSFGLKFLLYSGEGLIPSVSIIETAYMPIIHTDESFANDLTFSASNNIGDYFFATANFTWRHRVTASDEASYGLMLGANLVGDLSIFGEYKTDYYENDIDWVWRSYTGFGALYAVTDRIQLDASYTLEVGDKPERNERSYLRIGASARLFR
ncbi:hypothetical protein FUAX_25420 [Fulvitalea axinellae]|uniref:MetA-pathway of phenol degradation n=1 Tax=Fulvitalea axinellae TaxID=1182444 RepID=A0AAU9DCG5_9BACT|nr:hypothetical protein FUAX_25420 [Fulvitalea axinellae]